MTRLILLLIAVTGCTSGAAPTEPCTRVDTIAPDQRVQVKPGQQLCIVVQWDGAE